MAESRFTRTALRMSSGIIIWAAHFLAIYGFTALACARGFATARWMGIGAVPWMIGVATLIAAAALVALIASAARAANSSFTEWMAAALGGLALIAVAWEAMAVLMVPACA